MWALHEPSAPTWLRHIDGTVGYGPKASVQLSDPQLEVAD
jgi:hypothetical protein